MELQERPHLRCSGFFIKKHKLTVAQKGIVRPIQLEEWRLMEEEFD